MQTANYHELTAFIGAPESVADRLCQAAQAATTDGEAEALRLFGALPAAIGRHREMGVPERITRDTFHDLVIALENYAASHGGAFGIDCYGEWLRHHFECNLFQVGRLQYILKPYQGYARLFVDDATGEIILTAENGITFRGDGLMDYDDGSPGKALMPACESHWTSEYDDDGRHIRANCLLVNGRAVRTSLLLDKAAWRPALNKGGFSLNIHIPRGQSLTREACVASLRDAWRFFRTFFPDRRAETFDCGSWMLETKLQDILPPSSGLVQFLLLFRRYPLKTSSWSFLHRIFGAEPTSVSDLAAFARTADRGTALRRGVADTWLAGGHLTSAGGIIHQYDLMKL